MSARRETKLALAFAGGVAVGALSVVARLAIEAETPLRVNEPSMPNAMPEEASARAVTRNLGAPPPPPGPAHAAPFGTPRTDDDVDVDDSRASAPSATDPLARVRALTADPRPAAVAGLAALLSSRDAAVLLETLDTLIARGDPSALPAVLRVDLSVPGVAPSAVVAMGKLGAAATATARDAALRRLTEILNDEKKRPDLGVLLHVYEALGELADPRSVELLERELADDTVPRAGKHLVVLALGRIGERRSAPALAALRASLATPAADPLEEAIRTELTRAIDDVLAALG